MNSGSGVKDHSFHATVNLSPMRRFSVTDAAYKSVYKSWKGLDNKN